MAAPSISRHPGCVDRRRLGGFGIFTSHRERRLWLVAAFTTATIFSTLGLAGTWVGGLGSSDLNAATFVLGFLLVLGAIGVRGSGRRIGGMEAFAAIGVIAVYVLVLTRLMSFAERSHLMEYGVVAIVIHAALAERSQKVTSVKHPGLMAIGMTALIGATDELVQLALPARVFDPVDILFNTAAAVMSVSAVILLGWARARRRGDVDVRDQTQCANPERALLTAAYSLATSGKTPSWTETPHENGSTRR